jgi:hypothetical protein
VNKLAYVIFEVKTEDSGKINTLLKDDIVSRQSILTRDSSSLDVKGNFSYVKIDGSKAGLDQANKLAKELGFKKLGQKKAKEINNKIEEQEDSAATGMGMIFD